MVRNSKRERKGAGATRRGTGAWHCHVLLPMDGLDRTILLPVRACGGNRPGHLAGGSLPVPPVVRPRLHRTRLYFPPVPAEPTTRPSSLDGPSTSAKFSTFLVDSHRTAHPYDPSAPCGLYCLSDGPRTVHPDKRSQKTMGWGPWGCRLPRKDTWCWRAKATWLLQRKEAEREKSESTQPAAGEAEPTYVRGTGSCTWRTLAASWAEIWAAYLAQQSL